MLSPLDSLRLPLRLLDDVDRIADAVMELPRVVLLMIELRDEIRGMRADLADVPDRIQSLDESMSTLPVQVDRLRGDVGDLGEQLTGMRADLADVPERVHLMQTELDGLTGTLNQVRRVIEEARDGIRPLDEDMASVERAVQALPPKLDELRNQLDGMRTDLSGLPFVSKGE